VQSPIWLLVALIIIVVVVVVVVVVKHSKTIGPLQSHCNNSCPFNGHPAG
jgi:preprotein translocase subunit SecG